MSDEPGNLKQLFLKDSLGFLLLPQNGERFNY